MIPLIYEMRYLDDVDGLKHYYFKVINGKIKILTKPLNIPEAFDFVLSCGKNRFPMVSIKQYGSYRLIIKAIG